MIRFSLFISYLLSITLCQAQFLYPGHVYEDYYRAFELKNKGIEDRINYFPVSLDCYEKDNAKWDIWSLNQTKDENIQVLPVYLSNNYNTAFFNGSNDGAVWQGKGFNSALTFGLQADYSIFKFVFAPVIFYSQNLSFPLANHNGSSNSFNYQFGHIDYVQRYGNKAQYNFDWGQSEFRIVYKSMTIGATTSNMIWGPAQFNPILMSRNASGIPRIEFGTFKPINTKIGRIEGKIYWGLLSESNFFDDNSDNDRRYWSGLSLGYGPSFIPGLMLGVNRALYKSFESYSSKDLFIMFNNYKDPQFGVNGNDEYDQMVSVTARWLLKESGFEIYIEFAKNDFGSGIFRQEPEHARGYTIGFNKLFDLKNDKVLKFGYEHTSVDKAKTGLLRRHNSWYSHGIVKQGYTNNGQIIGANIGPGSVSDYFELQHIHKKGIFKINYQRVRFNDDYFYDNFQNYNLHDHEWSTTPSYTRIWQNYMVELSLGLRSRRQLYFVENQHIFNWQFGLDITKSF